MDALEALRERIAGGLSSLVDREFWGGPVDPDLVPPPSLPAYREFMAGLKASLTWEAAAEHYRQAARLDSTFVAPLIQLAFIATGNDECSITDSIGVVLEPRRDAADCMEQHHDGQAARPLPGRNGEGGAPSRATVSSAIPDQFSRGARMQQWGYKPPIGRGLLGRICRPAREELLRSDPERAMEWTSWYWWRMAATYHTPGEYRCRARHHRSLAGLRRPRGGRRSAAVRSPLSAGSER